MLKSLKQQEVAESYITRLNSLFQSAISEHIALEADVLPNFRKQTISSCS